MATVQEPKTPPTSYVPPITSAEVERQNAAMIRLLDTWDVEENEEEDRRVMQELEKALGPGRTLSSEGVF